MLRFQSVLTALVLLVSIACDSPGRSVTRPSSVSAPALSFERAAGPVVDGGHEQAVWNAPLNLVLSGQSNAGRIKPFLETRAAVVGYSAYAGIAISPCWDDVPTQANGFDGRCWAELKTQLAATRVDAFVWWHGDADDAGSPYGARIADLFRRVRAEANNPHLPIVILQLGAVNSEEPDSPSGQARAWARADPDAIYVETRDKEYLADRQHMTDQGYRDVADRIVTMVKAKTGRGSNGG